ARLLDTDPVFLGSLRSADLLVLRDSRLDVARGAGRPARAGLPEGPRGEQADAAGVPCPAGLPVLSARQARPGPAGARARKDGFPGLRGRRRPLAAEPEEAMSARALVAVPACALALSTLAGCAKPYDYTNFRQHRPRSILVLLPKNESNTADAAWSYQSTV